MLKIDGSILEGGGQILRNCVAYSVVLGKDFTCEKIRGNREKPGLKRQHLAGVRLAAQLTHSKLTGDELDSMQLTVYPGKLSNPNPNSNVDCHIGSAGACSLVIQSILPVLMFQRNTTDANPTPVVVNITGGTNVPFSPPMDYVMHVLWPTLRRFYSNVSSFPEITMSKRGFQSRGGGQVSIRTNGRLGRFRPIRLLERGNVIRYSLHLGGNVNSEKLTVCFTEAFARQTTLNARINEILQVVHAGETTTDSGNGFAMVVAETDTGCLFAGSALSGKKTTVEKLAANCLKRLNKQLHSKACVDEYLQDQLIIFMALSKMARGSSDSDSVPNCSEIVASHPLTLHTETAIHFAQIMSGVQFRVVPDGHGLCKIRC